MARPSLKAEFFIDSNGVAIRKAGPLKQSIKFQFYEQSDKRCAICGELVRFGGRDYYYGDFMRPGQIDHIFPRCRGGQNELDNIQLLCLCCNSQKGTHDGKSREFRKIKKKILELKKRWS